MQGQDWLQISEYSSKYKVSVSTLRRRIKANEIEHRFDQGKYWIPDQPIQKYVRHADSPAEGRPKNTSLWETQAPREEVTKAATVSPSKEKTKESADGVLVAKAMIAELKGAYVQILQEKEEQILQLKEELADLRTLCRILESENERVRNQALPVSTITDWLHDEPEGEVSP